MYIIVAIFFIGILIFIIDVLAGIINNRLLTSLDGTKAGRLDLEIILRRYGNKSNIVLLYVLLDYKKKVNRY